MSNQDTGNYGEELACQFLKKAGFRILQRNYRIRGGEIDIICRDGQTLVFVEVKCRYSREFGLPDESITGWKIKSLLKTAQFFIQKINWGNREYRIDFVGIDFSQDRTNPQIELIKNITF